MLRCRQINDDDIFYGGMRHMREVINFNTKWAFTKEATEVPKEMPEKWYWVTLPHSWNEIDGQDGGNDYYRGTCYYAKQLKKSELPEADCYYLELRGANASADVYVNGKAVAHHDGGYSTWRVDITKELTEEENLIVIAVENGVNDRVYPQNADFTFYGGLYRDVNIIAVNKSHFDLDYYGGPGIKVTPEIKGADASVEVEVFLTNAAADQKLVYTVKDAEGKEVAKTETAAGETKAVLSIPAVHLWNGKKDPYLYTAEVALVSGEETVDAVSTRFGCRTFEIDPERGFILNGEEYPLRGVSRHQDRWGIGNALLPEHHREDIDLICELGADDCRKRSGGKSVAGSGERSRQHGRCTEHDKSGKCGADRERRSDGCGAGRCRRTDGRGADRCRSAGGCGTEYGVWGRPEYGVHPDGGGRKPCGLQLYGGTGSGTSDSGDNGQRNA